MKPVVIAGTGLAGYTTAREFRKHDTETPLVLVTADDGTSYSKPMLSNAIARGKTPADLGMATAEDMAGQLQATMHTHRRIEALDAEDLRLTLDGGETLEASRIVLAIGAEQADPGLEGDGAEDVFAVNDLAAYARVRAALDGAGRVVMIGGGLIGCEFANDWRKAGHEITVIEPCAYPMGTMLPPVAGEHLRESLRGQGIRFLGGRAGRAVERADGGLVVHDDSGEAHPADVVVRAIGLRPKTALAQAAGLETGRGIRTDRALETSAPGIHALGDCAEVDGVVLPFVMPINHCARALGATLAGSRTEVEYPVMPVIAKTPCCPVQLYAPPGGTAGEWSEETLEGGTRGLFHGADGRLRGFCLTGTAVQEKGEWAAQVPKVFDNRD
jgi:rubredoxin-NAD+ reductase